MKSIYIISTFIIASFGCASHPMDVNPPANHSIEHKEDSFDEQERLQQAKELQERSVIRIQKRLQDYNNKYVQCVEKKSKKRCHDLLVELCKVEFLDAVGNHYKGDYCRDLK